MLKVNKTLPLFLLINDLQDTYLHLESFLYVYFSCIIPENFSRKLHTYIKKLLWMQCFELYITYHILENNCINFFYLFIFIFSSTFRDYKKPTHFPSHQVVALVYPEMTMESTSRVLPTVVAVQLVQQGVLPLLVPSGLERKRIVVCMEEAAQKVIYRVQSFLSTNR